MSMAINRTIWRLAIGVLLLVGGCDATVRYDVVIRGGQIHDGTGRAPYTADIAIVGKRIAKIGDVRGRAELDIDASGMVVSPGFIGLAQPRRVPRGRRFAKQRSQHPAAGSDDRRHRPRRFGTHELADYFDRIERAGIGVNVLHTVGHNTIREIAMQGWHDRAPTPGEMASMRDMVHQAMREGAVGLSSGLFFAPGSYSETGEVVELARIVAEYGGIYSTHIRDEGDYAYDVSRREGLFEAIDEAIEIGRQSGVTVNITHIKVEGIGDRRLWGGSRRVLQSIDAARERGQRVYADQYPYTAGSTELSSVVVPAWALEGGKLRERLADPAQRQRVKASIGELLETGLGGGAIVVSEFPLRPDLEGRSISEIGQQQGDRSAVETVVGILEQGDPGVVVHSIDQGDLERFMRQPYVSTSSDGGNPVFGESLPHPRAYGAFARKIGKYAVQDGVVDLPFAIRAATSLPAEVLGLDDRGTIRTGFAADLIVFDPQQFTDVATFEKPHQYSVGLSYMLIAGQLVLENDRYTGVLAGRALRRATHGR